MKNFIKCMQHEQYSKMIEKIKITSRVHFTGNFNCIGCRKILIGWWNSQNYTVRLHINIKFNTPHFLTWKWIFSKMSTLRFCTIKRSEKCKLGFCTISELSKLNFPHMQIMFVKIKNQNLLQGGKYLYACLQSLFLKNVLFPITSYSIWTNPTFSM